MSDRPTGPMIRPELIESLRRWREALAGAGVTALGLYWIFGSGLLAVAGWPVAALGAALTFVGVQRGLFRRGGGGAGIVRLVEGQLAYFGPETGGTLAVADIRRLARHGDLWLIDGADGTRLRIPVNAEGAECLLDVFAMLPGLDISTAVKAARRPAGEMRILWQRSDLRLH